jgi:hypothetical protein
MSHPAERQGVTKSLQDEADEPREDASDEEKEALMAQLKLLGYMD